MLKLLINVFLYILFNATDNSVSTQMFETYCYICINIIFGLKSAVFSFQLNVFRHCLFPSKDQTGNYVVGMLRTWPTLQALEHLVYLNNYV